MMPTFYRAFIISPRNGLRLLLLKYFRSKYSTPTTPTIHVYIYIYLTLKMASKRISPNQCEGLVMYSCMLNQIKAIIETLERSTKLDSNHCCPESIPVISMAAGQPHGILLLSNFVQLGSVDSKHS
jgi:hypothetical protein